MSFMDDHEVEYYRSHNWIIFSELTFWAWMWREVKCCESACSLLWNWSKRPSFKSKCGFLSVNSVFAVPNTWTYLPPNIIMNPWLCTMKSDLCKEVCNLVATILDHSVVQDEYLRVGCGEQLHWQRLSWQPPWPERAYAGAGLCHLPENWHWWILRQKISSEKKTLKVQISLLIFALKKVLI